MLLKSCQSVLPDTLYVSEGILLPLFYTVNHLNGEIPLPTPGKMAPKLCALLPNLLAVTTMPLQLISYHFIICQAYIK